MVDGATVEEYSSEYVIDFDTGAKYTELEGVITFRGNSFRDTAAYGTADITAKKLQTVWTQATGGLSDVDGNYWSGNGWVGQPLIVKWPDATRKNMVAMYEWAREKDGLVEVIYASMDGYIHFYELESGEKTRDAMYMGYTFKGVGALDPRGYPILYLGSGVHSPSGRSRAFVVNLVNNTVMYEFGNNENFAYRAWPMFDGSPLVSAATDQLIYPSENGILYIIHLNTSYDEETGELSVNPDNVVKWRYNGVRSGGAYWLGMESSPLIINHYIFMADNGGNLMCLDLNTLKLVWVQNTLDDTNCTPVLDIEDGHPYIYISTSFHYGWRSYTTAAVPVWKIDAETGEIVWQKDYTCYTVADLSGGVQGTIAVGKNSLSDLIFVPIARTPSASGGTLAALNKQTGEVVWEFQTSMYSWSSPVDVYDADGKGYIVYTNCGGNIYFIDGLTGEQLDVMSVGANIEASPSVYNNYLVVGHRGCRTYCVQMT
ncbi:MAG: PQQ-like beta-propeller repeat protein [Oscillospiraceae bacterium]|nr:PQQ-like beta-propeller repeat protein [Oscillospiraceae bacterium]